MLRYHQRSMSTIPDLAPFLNMQIHSTEQRNQVKSSLLPGFVIDPVPPLKILNFCSISRNCHPTMTNLNGVILKQPRFDLYVPEDRDTDNLKLNMYKRNVGTFVGSLIKPTTLATRSSGTILCWCYQVGRVYGMLICQKMFSNIGVQPVQKGTSRAHVQTRYRNACF